VVRVQISNIQIQQALKIKLNRMREAEKTERTSATGADKLTLSGKAADVQSVRSKLSGLPEIRTGVVKGFKSKVDSGSYEAGGNDVATSMFQSAFINRTRV
jgi:anti-sigma28 factor (negative regulator of flagellin synthesis)